MMRIIPALLLLSACSLPKLPGSKTGDDDASKFPEPEGVPELVTKNVSVARADIRIWDVEPTSPVRQGSSTSSEQGTLDIAWSDGTTTSHDATYRTTSGTLFQDGKVCHNYGPSCYCGTTVFRFESGATMWKFGTPSNNQPVACPSGVTPTGDAEIRHSSTAPTSKAERDALKEKIRREHATKPRGH